MQIHIPRRKKELETKIKTKIDMREQNHKKNQVNFYVKVKADIKPYVGEVDAIKLNQWLQQMDMYISVHEVSGK
jgi:hypothetical protein